LFFWVFLLYYFRGSWFNQLPQSKILFNLALFLGGFGHIAGLIPSGFRYLMISRFLFFGLIILALTQKTFYQKVQRFNFLTIPVLGYHLIFLIRIGFEYMTLNTFIGNVFTAFLFPRLTPLIEIIKGNF